MWKTEQKIQSFVEKYNMIQPKDVLVAGISGGADSVCLLYMLKKLQENIDFSFWAVHVNHNLRGEEASRDENFVKDLCEKEEVPYLSIHKDVQDLAAKEGMSLEEAGRKARYEAFGQVCKEKNAGKIVLAHHQDDLAETMIHHLARGTGMAGLCSMRPVSGNRIRPLLCIGRREIESYLLAAEKEWKDDSTNMDDHFTRNKIRHHVISYLCQEINPQTTAHMAETANELAQAEELIESIVCEKMKEAVEQREHSIFIKEEMSKEKEYLQNRIFMEVFGEAAGSKKDFTRLHVEAAEGLWKKQVGKQVALPYGLRAIREYEGILLTSENIEKNSGEEDAVILLIPGVTKVGEYDVKCEIIPHNFTGIVEKKYTKWLDYDKMKNSLEIRHRRSKDRISVHPSGGSKKLKDYMIDRKIPQKQRDQLYLLADGQVIAWVITDRISEKYKVTDKTRQVLHIQIRGGNIHE
ncbi:MAG: tRNA lysidine(34) synthetase TilS [Clostridia bacterium]|nr:tRNA lysidine(34) synthetase TilS [Clostridia bacterium]